MEELFKRIGKKINIVNLSKTICKTYCLGEYRNYELILVGIDDLSYYLHTSKGRYVVKIINHVKTKQQIEEFIQKNLVIISQYQNAPKIISYNENLLFTYNKEGITIKLVVMECIEGKDLYSINQKITKEDIRKLIEILVPFHQIKTRINIRDYDDYCFMKIKQDYERTKSFLPKSIKIKVERAIKEFEQIELEKLPNCFIHGDLISTNIMKDKQEKLWLIDFYESGNGIRILDIVKILNSVINNYQYEDNEYLSKESIEELENYFLEEYHKKIPLTQYELEVLPNLRKIDACVGIMLETYDGLKNKDNAENEYWLEKDNQLYKRLEK